MLIVNHAQIKRLKYWVFGLAILKFPDETMISSACIYPISISHLPFPNIDKTFQSEKFTRKYMSKYLLNIL